MKRRLPLSPHHGTAAMIIMVVMACAAVLPSGCYAFSPVPVASFRRNHINHPRIIPHLDASFLSGVLPTDVFSNNNDEEDDEDEGEGDEEENNILFHMFGNIPAQQLLEGGIKVASRQLKLPRALEIRLVLLQEILQPVLSSFLETTEDNSNNNNNSSSNDKEDEEDTVDWNVFWGQTSGQYTNARHVAKALEELGPIYVKFGQLLAARPDIVPQTLADELLNLQDNMEPFDTVKAHSIIRQELLQKIAATDDDNDNNSNNYNNYFVDQFMDSLTADPIGAASIGQVYKGTLPNNGTVVAVKVKRPDIWEKVERDAKLLGSFAEWLESWTLPTGNRRLIAVRLVDAVDEFTSRVFEEMDYQQEAANTQLFRDYYMNNVTCNYNVVVPEIYPELCTDNVLVMEWLEGEKITSCHSRSDEPHSAVSRQETQENLKLIKNGIEFTLFQLLSCGVVHADPHLGNLLKVNTTTGNEQPTTTLAYLDFGILSTVSHDVRDSIVCAVVDLVFAQNVKAVAQLFENSGFIQYNNDTERTAFEKELNETYHSLLSCSDNGKGEIKEDTTRSAVGNLPKLQFDKVLLSFSRLVTHFEFKLPPYFFNNFRALVTLEGIARGLDPQFNVMDIIYPFALDRLWNNPNVSRTVEDNFRRMFRSPETDMLDINVGLKMITEMSKITGRSRIRVFLDAAEASGARRVFRGIWFDMVKATFSDLAKKIMSEQRLLRSSLRSFFRRLWGRLPLRAPRQG